jgi:very-short-patch-repair endonuclease
MLRYKAQLKHKARQLRKNMTDSERVLWSRLRGKQLFGVQFLRQKPIGDYIVDFYAPRAKLVVEVDGSQHMEAEQAEKDEERNTYLAAVGLKVLRFTSREVIVETDAVVEVIYRTMAKQFNR